MTRSTTFNISHGGNRTGSRLGVCWLLGWFALAGFFIARGFSGYAAGALSRARNEQLEVTSVTSIAHPSPRRTKSIEDIRVGERVVTDLPDELREQALGSASDQLWWDTEEVDPSTWRRIELSMSDGDGRFDIVLLRPDRWLIESDAIVGGSIHLILPEQGLDGPVTVQAIHPCPPIKPGSGRVVTGTFTHLRGGIIDLHLAGVPQPLGVTENHLIFCVNRGQFQHAGDLRIGDVLRSLDGETSVESIQPRPEGSRVYNLEVHGDHVFRVTTGGVLVHNTSPRPHGELVKDFKVNPQNWERTGAQVGETLSGRNKGSLNVETQWRHRITGEGLSTHEVHGSPHGNPHPENVSPNLPGGGAIRPRNRAKGIP